MEKISLSHKEKLSGWSLFLCGICMGLADLVPGISGGTIAFILGFYAPLLASLQSLNWKSLELLFKGRWTEFSNSVEWKFLLVLAAGIITAFVCFANFIHFILEHELYRIYLYATFLGLILASFVFCVRQVKKWNSQLFLGLVLGAIAAYALTESMFTQSKGSYAVELYVENATPHLTNYQSDNNLLTGLSIQSLKVLMSQGRLQDTTPIYDNQHLLIGLAGDLIVPSPASFFNGWLVFCGALAVCALLLPGISGSYILTLLGVYPLVIEALVEFVNSLVKAQFDIEAFATLASLGIGIVIGAIGFARSLSWLLKTYPDHALAVLSGFMIGAIRSVWPFWIYEYALLPFKLYKGPQMVFLHPIFPPLDSPLAWQSLGCIILGFGLVVCLEIYAKKKTTSSN